MSMFDRDKAALLEGREAVIFDMDGSLVDSMWIWEQIDIEYLGHFGLAVPSDLREGIEGMSFHETAVYFKNRFPVDVTIEQMKQDWNDMAREKYRTEVDVKPGIREFLKGCRERGLKLGIATSNSRELTDIIMHSLNLEAYFDHIVTGSEIVKGKPAPDIYLTAAAGLNTDPAKCLVFEDIIQGLMAGKNAGMRVCAVHDAHTADLEATKRASADAYIYDYYGFFEEE